MNETAIQRQLDRPGGPHFKNNGYFAPLRKRVATGKWKTHGRNGGNIPTKLHRS